MATNHRNNNQWNHRRRAVAPILLRRHIHLNGEKPRRRLPGVLKLFLALATVGLVLVVVAAGAVAGVYTHYAQQLEGELARLDERTFFETTKIYDRNGYELYEIFQEGRRTRIDSLDQLPEEMIQATIAIEDRTFWENPGVDLSGIIRAGLAILVNYVQEGQFEVVAGGGSTLTQQFIRNALFTLEERTSLRLERKIREAILALELTQTKEKEEILLMFFNEIPYGNLSFGVEAAAQSYFGKGVGDLDLAECAFLAGLPQGPTEYNPFFEGGLERAKARQLTVLSAMVRNGYISQARADAAYREELNFVPPVISIEAPHFVMYVRQLLEELPQVGPEKLYGGGLSIYTTLDIRYQRLAEAVVKERMSRDDVSPSSADDPRYNAHNAAMVVMRPETGEILAMVGSVDYDMEKQSVCGLSTNVVDGNVNAALAKRQPGSSFKPFTYLNAFLNGWSPATMLLDVETEFPVPGHEPYIPHNHDGVVHGPVRVRVALGNSMNIPAVKTIQFAGVGETINLAQRLGITGLGDPSFYGLSLTLGGGEVRLLDMVNAYCTLANEGRHVDDQAILKVVDAEGNVLYEYEPRPLEESPEIVDPRFVYLVTNILSDDNARLLTYAAHSILELSRPAAVKTGTAEDWSDNWTIGYTPYLVAGAWVGNNNNEAMTWACAPREDATRGMPSSRTAGHIWHNFMEGIFQPTSQLPIFFPDDEERGALFGDGDLKYAHYDGEEWLVETVDAGGWVGSHTSIAVDAQGSPRISYCAYDRDDLTCDGLRYARLESGGWITETVDDAQWVGAYSSLALDAGGDAHIGYFDRVGGAVKYAHFDGSAWTIEVVESGLGEEGGHISLALDLRGRPHVSYYDAKGREIKYASRETGGWRIETIADAGNRPLYSSLALNSAGRPRISYYDTVSPTFALKLAERDGSDWQIGVVDGEGQMGAYTSLVLDAEGYPHLSYCLYDPEEGVCGELRYAYSDGVDWHIETVASRGEVGEFSSLTLDAQGLAHISYYDYGEEDLMYAYDDGSSWQIQTIDSEGWVGRYTSLALDRDGRPHISYLSYVSQDLEEVLRHEGESLQYDFRRPSGIVKKEVCANSGLLPNGVCPVVTEVFIEGNEPKKEDDVNKAMTVVLIPGSNPPRYCLPLPGVVYPPELVQYHVFLDLLKYARIEEIPGLEKWMQEAGIPSMPTEYCPQEMGVLPGGEGPPENPWAGLMREITYPRPNGGITGPIEIRGSADIISPRPEYQFAHYRLEWGQKGPLGEMPTEWHNIATEGGQTAVRRGILATWDPGDLPDGGYVLRLAVVAQNGEEPGYTTVPVYLDRGDIFVRVLSPKPGAVLTEETTTIRVKVEGVSPAAKVDFFYDGIYIGSAITDTVFPLSERVYTVTWPVRPGPHKLKVEVVNTAGRRASSQEVTVVGEPPEGAFFERRTWLAGWPVRTSWAVLPRKVTAGWGLKARAL